MEGAQRYVRAAQIWMVRVNENARFRTLLSELSGIKRGPGICRNTAHLRIVAQSRFDVDHNYNYNANASSILIYKRTLSPAQSICKDASARLRRDSVYAESYIR